MAQAPESVTVRVKIKGTCSTCRFWRQYSSKDDYSDDRGHCDLVVMTLAKKEQLRLADWPRMHATDYGSLDTAADFGCVEFQPKDA